MEKTAKLGVWQSDQAGILKILAEISKLRAGNLVLLLTNAAFSGNSGLITQKSRSDIVK
jgi:hypothetical protein